MTRAFALMLAVLSVSTSAALAQSPVERGSYLVNTLMTCHNCHTPIGPNGPQFDRALSGGLRFNAPAFDVTAANITPDLEAGIGKWSADEIKKTLVTGVRPNGVPLAPAMPTAFYQVITARDLDGIAAYLKSVPAVSNKVVGPVWEPYAHRRARRRSADVGGGLRARSSTDSILRPLPIAWNVTPGDRQAQRLQPARQGRSRIRAVGVSISRIDREQDRQARQLERRRDQARHNTGLHRDSSRLKPPMASLLCQNDGRDLDDVVAWLRTLPPKE